MDKNTDGINEILKGCSVETRSAVLEYRKNKSPSLLPAIVIGIIEKHLEDESKVILERGGDDLLITEDLGIDSIIMMEIVMNIEEVLSLSVPNEELTDLRSVGDLKYYLERKSQNLSIPVREQLEVEEVEAILPHQKPFLFVQQAELYGKNCTGMYRITGDEYFLKGHFKNDPLFPGSLMLESLGQLAVLMLLKSKHIHPADKKVDNRRVLFATCDGVRCTRLCKPKDILKLSVSLQKIKYPLAFFKGKITTGKSKVVSVKNISLAFDYIK